MVSISQKTTKVITVFSIISLGLMACGLWWYHYLGLNQAKLVEGERVVVAEIAHDAADTSVQVADNSIDQGENNQFESSLVSFRLEVVAENLTVPWSLVFTSQNRLLITERPGTIRAVVNDQLQPQPLITFPEVSHRSEEGLMGLEKDPQYQQNHYLYACYAYQDDQDQKLYDRVVRLIDHQTHIEIDQVLLDRIPAAVFHAGCRLKIGPDHKLYITTGDATNREQAQKLDSLSGKILRLNLDGTFPTDNPINNSAIYSFGHRNPQGLAWHPVTGHLWSTEHGPSGNDGPGGGDEVNRIQPGGNYGWPLVSHTNNQPGLIAPELVFTPAVAPASAHFYTGTSIPGWQHNLLIGLLRGEGIMRIQLSETDADQVLWYEKVAGINVGRVRDITQAPDSTLYLSTSNQDGRGRLLPGDDHVYRLIPIFE